MGLKRGSTSCLRFVLDICSRSVLPSRVIRVGLRYVQLAVERYRIGRKVYTKTTLPRLTLPKPYVNAYNNVKSRYIGYRSTLLTYIGQRYLPTFSIQRYTVRYTTARLTYRYAMVYNGIQGVEGPRGVQAYIYTRNDSGG